MKLRDGNQEQTKIVPEEQFVKESNGHLKLLKNPRRPSTLGWLFVCWYLGFRSADHQGRTSKQNSELEQQGRLSSRGEMEAVCASSSDNCR
jgi:hypothetical protein